MVPPHGRLGALREWLQNFWPRILGLAPVLIVAAALFSRIFEYTNAGSLTARWSLFWLGIWHLIGACLLFVYFTARRKRVGDVHAALKFQDFGDRDEKSRESRAINWALLLLAAITLLTLWAFPQAVAVELGTGAMFALAATSWVTIGTRMMFYRARTGVPVIFLLAAWVLLNSCWMDNHRVRLSKGEHPLEAGPTVQAAFATWRKSVNSTPPAPGSSRIRPVFIVATEGGGIRAAYWTASVLGAVQWDSVNQDGEKVVWVSQQQRASQDQLKQTSLAVEAEPKQQEAQRENAEFKETKPGQFASELLSPPKALMATRGARGTLALREIIQHQEHAQEVLKKDNVTSPPVLISIHLHDDGIPLPLGWSLSHAAAGDMESQLWTDQDVVQAGITVRDWLKLATRP
jgi:hypothetical protein